MGDGIIKLNEEIDQVVEDLDGVVGSYKKRVDDLAGSQEGVAVHFHRAMSRGRTAAQKQFEEIDAILKQIAEAMKASVKDHRATEAEISDEVLRRLNEIAEAESRNQPPTHTQNASSPVDATPGAGSQARPDGSQ